MTVEAAILFVIIFTLAMLIFVHMVNRHKLKIKTHELLEKSLDKGIDVTPEMIEKLHQDRSPRYKDFRRGIIMAAIGAAVFCFSLIIPEDDTAKVFRGLSLFPFFVGAGFLLVWKVNKYDD
ncbi:DUF6249 domain-containing protein [Marinicella meishanensis]|uniref:DUF6249 domain-containing protein n=1 Tax=Marinicella meishanensis TaxID=2873263 RepID=UPI001CBB4905|nr:DUF6249 domain-containing protein [Marinicella sp. NBU2979]